MGAEVSEFQGTLSYLEIWKSANITGGLFKIRERERELGEEGRGERGRQQRRRKGIIDKGR